MRFMIIVRANADSEAGVLPEDKLVAVMADYHEQLAKAGVLLDANGLQASSKGWRIKYSVSKRTVIDGPFTETKELIAGYTLIQVKIEGGGARVDAALPQPLRGGEGGRDRGPAGLRAGRPQPQRRGRSLQGDGEERSRPGAEEPG